MGDDIPQKGERGAVCVCGGGRGGGRWSVVVVVVVVCVGVCVLVCVCWGVQGLSLIKKDSHYRDEGYLPVPGWSSSQFYVTILSDRRLISLKSGKTGR